MKKIFIKSKIKLNNQYKNNNINFLIKINNNK